MATIAGDLGRRERDRIRGCGDGDSLGEPDGEAGAQTLSGGPGPQLDERLKLVERFKADAAILKNSLSYLPVALTRLRGSRSRTRPMGRPCGGSAGAARVVQLALTFNVLTKPELGEQLRAELDAAQAMEVSLPAET